MTAEVVRHPVYGAAFPAANWIPAPRYLMRRDLLLRLLRRERPGRVLEIGCGTAALLADLAELGFRGVGVDSSGGARALARALHPEGGPFEIAAEPPAAAGAFDYLFAFEVIEHIEEDVAALAAWRDQLGEGGRLIVSVPAHPELWNPADDWAGHVRRYTRKGLAETVGKAGFRLEALHCYGWPTANVMERVRSRVYARQLERKRKTAQDAAALTGESGTDRSAESRFWTLFATAPVAAAMRGACLLQRPFLSGDLGNGYVAVATRA